ncbi:hypothetical protein F0562_029047 [Nyssa sinensis]|uniref:Protein kinase domain-containing protein n=1 Tax=Nyssa sinensis TaxID=561372 RepID=A0A5J5B1J9_9ASTE|nr:hypothetical protein F0562_029047 [Nyssa sinensis]
MVVVNHEFKYEELEEATENFSSHRLVGKGSHGCIYKGTLKDGKLVAIKKPSLGLQKLQDNSKLDNEIHILSSLNQNPFLVNLRGTSHDSANRKILVMEFMPNGTLHDLLHVASAPPPWPKRAKMAIQIARAVQFLHQAKPIIIHRDIKSANILFDSKWNAKLGDFGLAVRVSERVDSLSQPAGTIGYLDPSYSTPSKLSTKNDVFSFGVVLLEIISGRKALDISRVPASMVEWAVSLIEDQYGDRMMEICDKRIALPASMEGSIRNMLHVAARCVSLKEDRRPSIGEEWMPQDIVATGEKCFLLKWVTEGMLRAMNEKAKEPEAAEPEPEPTTEVLFHCSNENCGKKFIDAGALRKHSHIHGERQYVSHYGNCGKEREISYALMQAVVR